MVKSGKMRMVGAGMLGRVAGAVLVVVVLIGAGAEPARAVGPVETTVVKLKASVVLEGAREAAGGEGVEGEVLRAVRLGEVADIAGPNAAELGELVVAEDVRRLGKASEGVGSVTLAEVRKALDGRRVNWGRTVLSGSACEVRFAWGSAGDGVARGERVDRGPEPEVVDVGGERTVRKAIAQQLAANLSVEPSALKLLLRASDEGVLDRPTGFWRVDVEVGSVTTSSRAPVRVFAYEGDRVALSVTVDAEIEVEREVLVAAREVSRGDSIDPSMVRAERRWMSPAQGALAAGSLQSLTGGGVAAPVAATRIREGTVITAELVQSPVAAKRGDVVWVHCLSGAVRIKAKARALETVRDGEIGSFKLEGGDEVFRARMSGMGRAVMVVGDEPGPGVPGSSGKGGPVAAAKTGGVR